MLTTDRLRELLHCDPKTGFFTRRSTVANQLVGSRAGNVGTNGYVQIRIDYQNYLGHRLAFLYMTGSWPLLQTDHRNGVRSDNRWRNLRDASQSQNSSNVKRHRDNTSGFKGIYFHKHSGLWAALITSGGVKKSLGYFKTAAAAHAAYVTAAKLQHGKFARTE